mmetsp:Transcript_15390/g.37898  ORF Transcript_15390/g.37898 Transcript_15390/m.37898 type:complete len:137 (-) Transcript_15390:261-671(-)
MPMLYNSFIFLFGSIANSTKRFRISSIASTATQTKTAVLTSSIATTVTQTKTAVLTNADAIHSPSSTSSIFCCDRFKYPNHVATRRPHCSDLPICWILNWPIQVTSQLTAGCHDTVHVFDLKRQHRGVSRAQFALR